MYGEICRGLALGDDSSTSPLGKCLFITSVQFETVSLDNFATVSRLLAKTVASSLFEHAFGLHGKGVRRSPSSLMGIPGDVTRSRSWSSLETHGKSSSGRSMEGSMGGTLGGSDEEEPGLAVRCSQLGKMDARRARGALFLLLSRQEGPTRAHPKAVWWTNG